MNSFSKGVVVKKYIVIIISTFLIHQSVIGQNISSDSIFMDYLEEQNFPISHNNDVTLLPTAVDKFTDLFKHIKQAKKHIHLEYFNFRNDSIATELFKLLVQKAQEGVEVRALFDAFGNSSNSKPLKKEHLKRIRSLGIEIEKYDPIRFPYINHIWKRDHRKIIVIDGIIAYTGGMNIADYYIHGDPDTYGQWYDMHMRIEGSAVKYFQQIFLNMWNKETKQHIGGSKYYPDPIEIDQSLQQTLAVVDRWPRKYPKTVRRAYKEAILSAEHTIRIINPYFVPTPSIRKALKKALKKGVTVEIMVPAVADIPLVPSTSVYIGNKLRKKGAYIYLFNGGFHHTKVMMIDDKFCTVGSVNLNSRSLRYDFETNVFIFNHRISNELDAIFFRDIHRSTLLTEEVWEDRKTWNKVTGWFGNLLTPFL